MFRAKRMATALTFAACLVWVAGLPSLAQSQTTATVFEGARLIPGDGGGPIENSALVMEGNRITAVGRRGEVMAPSGTARVELTGKTVMPALIDAHSHIGYMRNLTSGPQNYTRENILDHMYKFAYFGVAASMAMGSDFGDLPFQLLAGAGHRQKRPHRIARVGFREVEESPRPGKLSLRCYLEPKDLPEVVRAQPLGLADQHDMFVSQDLQSLEAPAETSYESQPSPLRTMSGGERLVYAGMAQRARGMVCGIRLMQGTRKIPCVVPDDME